MISNREQILLRIPKELNEELKETARRKGISKHSLILEILWKWQDK